MFLAGKIKSKSKILLGDILGYVLFQNVLILRSGWKWDGLCKTAVSSLKLEILKHRIPSQGTMKETQLITQPQETVH